MERWEVANKQSVISLAERLSLEATNFATMRPGEGIAALERFKKAEDEILKMIGKLEKGDTASKDKLVGIYSNVIRESDAIVAKTFTPEVIAAAPVRNLLSLDRKEWNATEEVSGFSFRIANGQLVVIGPDKGRAIMSIGDKEQWRDYVIEAELELASGNVQACLRLGATADNFTPTLFLDERAAPPNKTVKLIASVIGSKLNARAGDMEASFEFHVEDLKPANSRVGSFGLVVPPGCQLRFTKLGVKVLR
jgi:hypothetical protein